MPDEMVQIVPPLNVPTTYFNGFQIGLTNADVSMLMLLNGQPKMLANISFTAAKTLHMGLGEMIKALEDATTNPIMPMDEVARGLEKLQSQDSDAEEAKPNG